MRVGVSNNELLSHETFHDRLSVTATVSYKMVADPVAGEPVPPTTCDSSRLADSGIIMAQVGTDIRDRRDRRDGN